MYSVTVVTDPPSGPHPIGSTVNLTCLIHPQPPAEGVTYRWRDYLRYSSPVAAIASLPYPTFTIGRGHPHLPYPTLTIGRGHPHLPYTTLTIERGHPHTARYYCWVYYNSQVLATGNTVITVQGRLHQSRYQFYSVIIIVDINLLHVILILCCVYIGLLSYLYALHVYRFAVSNWANCCPVQHFRYCHLASEYHSNCNIHQGLPTSPHMVP